MISIRALLSIIVLLIGIYIVWQFRGATAPLLSGICFILLGVNGVLAKK